MAVSIKKYVDVESRALTKSADGSAYDKLLDGILENPKFKSAVLSAPSGLSDSTKESLNDYGSAETIGDALETIATAALSPMVAATHSQLLQMATNGQLMPGCQYRITDYVATTNGSMNSQSANHPFDLVVVADTEYSINEVARAIPHEGDTYFANCNLAAWKVWYSLKNDTDRFAWADSEWITWNYETSPDTRFYRSPGDDASGLWCWKSMTGLVVYTEGAPQAGAYVYGIPSNSPDGTVTEVPAPGKGVIYRLIDEFNNDCPYDFKGIQFKAYGDTDDVWRYTFDSGGARGNADLSLAGLGHSVCSNKISPCYIAGKQDLNYIVFKGEVCEFNTFGPGCHNNTFGWNCYNNTFGSDCYSNEFGSGCCNNTFGRNCYNNTFGYGCSSNTFGGGCYGNLFGQNCEFNTFGSDCHNNTFGSRYRYVEFEDGVSYVALDCTAERGTEVYYQNVTVSKGIIGTESEPKHIEDPNYNQPFKTTYSASGSKSEEL